MVSCEDLYTESASGSQENTLRSLKRSQLSRSRSGGGFFSNPFRNDERDRMEQLTEILNHYSALGIPTEPHVTLKSRELDEALFLEDHWRVIVINSDRLDSKIQ